MSKTAVFAILGALNFVNLVGSHKVRAKVHEDQNSLPLNVLK